MKYQTAESVIFPGHYHVEAIDRDGSIEVAVFSGPRAPMRALAYADWKNNTTENGEPRCNVVSILRDRCILEAGHPARCKFDPEPASLTR